MPGKQKKRLAGQSLKRELEAASHGLVYVSEIDSPIGPIFEVPDANISIGTFVLESLSDGRGPMEERPSADFFDRLTADREWHSADNKTTVRRFRKLRKLMVGSLADLTMFRAGRVRIEIFVVGSDSEGNIAGIRTSAVET